MRYFVTGGAGFLGYHLAQYLPKNQNHLFLDIAQFDPNEYPKNIKLVAGDVRDRRLLNSLMRPSSTEPAVDVIIHAAAALPLWPKKDIFDINVGGTRNILQLALKHKIKTIIFISSTAVYKTNIKYKQSLFSRQLENQISNIKYLPIKETNPLAGVGHYGHSKILAEKLCRKYRRQGLMVTILRPKTFIGPGRLGVFQILFDWVKDGKRIPMIGSGNNHYQLLEVTDLVSAILLCAHKDPKHPHIPHLTSHISHPTSHLSRINHTFNIGAKNFGTVKEDLNALCQYAKSGAKPLATPAWLVKPFLRLFEKLHLSPLYQWVYDTADKDSYVDTTKIETLLGWQPKYSNRQALIKTYQSYSKELKTHPAPTGITHRSAWKQGVLGVFKRLL